MKLDYTSNQIIIAASKEAENRKHEYITPEHILYSTLFYKEGSNIIRCCGGNIKQIQADLEQYFSQHIPKVSNIEPLESKGFQSVLNNTALHAMNSGQKIIKIGDILSAIYQEKDSFAVYCLEKQGIRKIDILNYICHGISSLENETVNYLHNQENPHPNNQQSKNNAAKKGQEFLSDFTEDLTQKAKQNKLDPVIHRNQALNRTIQILSRRIKNNPIHVGPPGVGKTAITEGLAQMIISKKIPKNLKNHKILSLDMSAVVAGTKYRGEFEERLRCLLQILNQSKNTIVYIDEIHTIVGAGAVSGSAMDASNILKPFLSKSNLKCIGSTTNEEYKKYFEKDKALSRRFQKIEIHEPSQTECIEILEGLKSKYEQFHNVLYSPESIKTAVHLSIKYIKNRFLPDKAIDVLDETGAFVKINEKKTKNTKILVKPKHIEETIAMMTNTPIESMHKNEIKNLSNLNKILKQKIFGQDHAINQVIEAIHIARAGFNQNNKLIASFLFVGPTGVGKTELSYQLANALNIPLIRFDMSEYQEKHSISKLIGSPPGYVGYEEGGILVDEIQQNPHSVLLLDEIEKAHPDIFNILLQIMDYASIKDKTNKKADFQNIILIMTSNAGAKDLGKNLLGFEQNKLDSSIMQKEIISLFSPEFRNRLSQTILFNNLTNETNLQITKKILSEFQIKFLTKGINLKISPKVYDWFTKNETIQKFGAREIHRMIDQNIKKHLIKELLFGKLKQGGNVDIRIQNNKIIITTNAKTNK